MYAYDFTRKPSFVSINCKIRDAIKAGHDWIQLTWGENQIILERGPWGWDGRGWIGKTGGMDIANKLQRGDQ